MCGERNENKRRRIGDLESFRDACRDLGLSVTRQRELVWQTLFRMKTHPSADRIYEAVRQEMPNISRMSVFRILDAFCVKGLIRRIDYPGSAVRYDADLSPHCHLVCRVCGGIIDWNNSDFENLKFPREAANYFEITDYSVSFSGICARCRAERDNALEEGKDDELRNEEDEITDKER